MAVGLANRRFAALAGAGATLAALVFALAYADAEAVGSSSGSGGEGRSSSIDNAYALAAQPDGKLVVAGVSGNRRAGLRRMAVARYTARGRLDRSFGVGGKALTSYGSGNSGARAVVLQTDGKIVLAGALEPDRFALARYTRRGRLDPSFGQGGKVVTRFGAGRSVSQAEALAIQPDGKLIALGEWFRSPLNGPSFIALARYTPRGKLDHSFGHGGKVVTSFGPRSDVSAAALLIRADGKLVVVGEYSSPGGSFAVALARYAPNGSLDPSFGTDGRVVSKLGDYLGGASAAVLQRDDKIVVDVNNEVRSYLVRYTVDGKLDSSFGVGGKAVASTRVLLLLALQRDGKLILAGSVTGRHGRAFALHRYTQNGEADSSFGRGGKAFTDFGSPAVANALALRADGKIVVAGTRGFNDFAVACYKSTGRPDGSFGSGGKVTTDFGSAWTTR
jgi:uncharacterized delta-60 repeat protein